MLEINPNRRITPADARVWQCFKEKPDFAEISQASPQQNAKLRAIKTLLRRKNSDKQ
jgi:hypothetical protein